MAGFNISYLIEVRDKFSQSLTKLQKDLAKIDHQAQVTGSHFAAMGARFNSIGKAMFYGVSLPLIGMAGYALKTTANFQDMQLKLEAVTGSAVAASTMMDNMKSIAESTGVAPESLAKGSQLLLSYGYSLDQVGAQLKTFTDLSAGSGIPLENLIRSIGRMKVMDKFQAISMQRLAGLPLIPYLKKVYAQMGVNDAQFGVLLHKNKIHFKEVQEALDLMERTQFQGMAVKHAKDIGGAMQRLHVIIRYFAFDLGNMFVKSGALDFFNNLLDVLVRAENKFHEFVSLHPQLAKMIIVVGSLTAAFAPLLIMLGWVVTPINAIILGITALAALGVYLFESFKPFHDLVVEIFDIFKEDITDAIYVLNAIGSAAEWVGKKMATGLGIDTSQGMFAQSQSVNSNVNINLNDPGKAVKSVSANSSSGAIGINNVSNMGWNHLGMGTI